MLLIFSPKTSKRLKYIFKLIFNDIIGTEFEITNNSEEFQSFEGIKINYSTKAFDDEIFFYSSKLLFEIGIVGQELKFIDFEDTKAFFPNYENNTALNFDPFAASFFLVSRYEEYLPYVRDKYSRFEAKESIAYKNGFLHKPLVNIYAQKIAEIISNEFPDFEPKKRNFSFFPTIDIDAAYSYKCKGVFRSLGGYYKSIIKLDFQEILERTEVILGLKKDPFDTYDYQFKIQKEYELKPIYFILFADYGLNDKNISVNNFKFQTLIKSLGDYAELGIHPSYGSTTNPEKLKKEVKKLSQVLKKEITKSRQHFLKLNLPTTYRNLINLDITDDYTMGYASEPGFRASICDPFYFYDLDLETETNLRIHPFAFMEGTLRDYKQLSDKESLLIIKSLIDEVKKVNGTFISIWHNESLSNKKRWEGWRKVYEEMIEISKN